MRTSREQYERPDMHIVRFAANDVVRTSGAPGEGWTFCPSNNTWVQPGWTCYY